VIRGGESVIATTTEIDMKRTKRRDDVDGLPEPIALTPEQLKEIASETAGGCGCVVVVTHPPIIAGGIRVAQ
jgi:hypothetical protein